MLVQIIDRFWASVSVEVVGTGTDDVARLSQAPRDQGGVFEIGDANGDVEPFFQEVDQSIVEIDVELEVGVAFEEVVDRIREMTLAEAQGSSDAQPTRQCTVLLADRKLGVLEIVDQPFGPLVQQPTACGQTQSPGGALEELDTKPALQLTEPPADGGLGDLEALGRRRQGSSFDDRDEGLMLEVAIHCCDTKNNEFSCDDFISAA